VGQLETEMTHRELRDWHRFARAHPLPDTLADIHVAMICSMIANAVRDANSPPAQPTDFMVLLRPQADEHQDAPRMSEAERFKSAIRGD
jgi:hypothetical protein